MDTPQGTFYRKMRLSAQLETSRVILTCTAGVYFDIYLTLDGSEFNAELVCQGEVMGRCTARFR